MTIKKSTLLADAVLALVEFLSDDDFHFYVEPYQNGREHGWALQKFAKDDTIKCAVFSQDRHSDRIVLYLGKNSDFLMQGNIPSDKVYNNRIFFDIDSIYGCAECIVAYFGD